jgi:DNA-binding NtrC family response regulator
MRLTTPGQSSLGSIIGCDAGLAEVLARAQSVATTRVPVLITGETGTGKDLLARLIHDRGGRANGPYVAVNCGTLSRELADSALFGHERGSFTGATGRKVGWFEEANGGTLVLDEIGELPLELQAKLLRVLETGRLRRVGGAGEIAVDVRLVAVTWRDLRDEMRNGTFRHDLFHRLSAFELTLPPLRERPGDIPLLVEGFLNEMAPEIGQRTVDAEALTRLMAHTWPGNIRELRNVLTRATILSADRIGLAALNLPRDDGFLEGQLQNRRGPPPGGHRLGEDGPPAFVPAAPANAANPAGLAGARLPPSLDGADTIRLRGQSLADLEKSIFEWALRCHGGSRRRAARALAVPRSTFCDRAKRYGLA